MLISVFLTQAKRKCQQIFCSDNQILDWLWRVVLFVLMVWQRFPDAAELNILTIKPTSTQFGPHPIFQDLLSSKDFLSMWNWEFYRKGLFSWLIVIFFLLLRVDSSGDFDFPQLENSLQVNPFPPHPASFLFFIINVMLFPHFAGNHIPCVSHTSSHSSSTCISPSLRPWMTFAPKAWGAFAADWKWGRPAPTATPPQVW